MSPMDLLHKVLPSKDKALEELSQRSFIVEYNFLFVECVRMFKHPSCKLSFIT